jgi:hypothetical protein
MQIDNQIASHRWRSRHANSNHFPDGTGKVIRLLPYETIVLTYMASCVRETITGGTVVVGSEGSKVVAGSIERTRIDCDGGRMHLTAEQANAFSGRVFRGGPKSSHSRSGPVDGPETGREGAASGP